MLKLGINLTFFNIVGRVFNFLLYLVIANKFGADNNTDWFFFLYSFIYLVNTILIKSVESVLVPILHKEGENSALLFLNFTIFSAVKAFFVISFGCLLIGFVIAPTIMGASMAANWRMGILICLILGCQPSLALLSAYFSSFLQVQQQYILPTIQLTLRSIGILPFLFLPACKTILCLAMAFLFGEIVRLAVFCKNNLKKIFAINNTNALPEQNINKLLFQHIGWISLALASSQLNPTIDLAMVGRIGQGSITLVDYSSKIRGIPVLALGGLLTLLLGEWSAQHIKKGIELTSQQITHMVTIVVISTAFVTVLLLFSVDQWVPFIFYSKKFTDNDLANISNLLIGYLPGVPFLAGFFVLSRALLVFQKTKALALAAVASIFLNIVSNLLLIHLFGLIGVAISTSCIDTLLFIVLALIVKKQCLHRKTCSSVSQISDI